VSLSVSPLAARDSSAALTIIHCIYSANLMNSVGPLGIGDGAADSLIHCQRRSVQEDIEVDISLPLFLLQWR
jgi:hypothetical protein